MIKYTFDTNLIGQQRFVTYIYIYVNIIHPFSHDNTNFKLYFCFLRKSKIIHADSSYTEVDQALQTSRGHNFTDNIN